MFNFWSPVQLFAAPCDNLWIDANYREGTHLSIDHGVTASSRKPEKDSLEDRKPGIAKEILIVMYGRVPFFNWAEARPLTDADAIRIYTELQGVAAELLSVADRFKLNENDRNRFIAIAEDIRKKIDTSSEKYNSFARTSEKINAFTGLVTRIQASLFDLLVSTYFEGEKFWFGKNIFEFYQTKTSRGILAIDIIVKKKNGRYSWIEVRNNAMNWTLVDYAKWAGIAESQLLPGIKEFHSASFKSRTQTVDQSLISKFTYQKEVRSTLGRNGDIDIVLVTKYPVPAVQKNVVEEIGITTWPLLGSPVPFFPAYFSAIQTQIRKDTFETVPEQNSASNEVKGKEISKALHLSQRVLQANLTEEMSKSSSLTREVAPNIYNFDETNQQDSEVSSLAKLSKFLKGKFLTIGNFGENTIPAIDAVYYPAEGSPINLSVKSPTKEEKYNAILSLVRNLKKAQDEIKNGYSAKYLAAMFGVTLTQNGILPTSGYDGKVYRENIVKALFKILGLTVDNSKNRAVGIFIDMSSYKFHKPVFKTKPESGNDVMLRLVDERIDEAQIAHPKMLNLSSIVRKINEGGLVKHYYFLFTDTLIHIDGAGVHLIDAASAEAKKLIYNLRFGSEQNVIPNELNFNDSAVILRQATRGVYLTVGTERAFQGVALAKEATHLLVVDKEPLVSLYNQMNLELIKLSGGSREKYLAMRNSSTWFEFLKNKGTVTLGSHSKLNQDSWKMWAEAQQEDGNEIISENSLTYYNNDELFERLYQLASNNKITILTLDLRSTEKIIETINQIQEPLSIVDLSNAWWASHGYLKHEETHAVLRKLKVVSSQSSLVIFTTNSMGGGFRNWIYVGINLNSAANSHIGNFAKKLSYMYNNALTVVKPNQINDWARIKP